MTEFLGELASPFNTTMLWMNMSIEERCPFKLDITFGHYLYNPLLNICFEWSLTPLPSYCQALFHQM